jgi:uncharacterized protein (UPF0335 family)
VNCLTQVHAHEDEPNKEEPTVAENVAADQLRQFIERIERLAEERKGIADDIADVYAEAKAQGYDKPTMRRIVRLRAMDESARQEAAALLETYADALGLQAALPL